MRLNTHRSPGTSIGDHGTYVLLRLSEDGHLGRQRPAPEELLVKFGQGAQTPPPAWLYVSAGQATGAALSEQTCPAGHMHPVSDRVIRNENGRALGQGSHDATPARDE
jgi:hypothetical protein